MNKIIFLYFILVGIAAGQALLAVLFLTGDIPARYIYSGLHISSVIATLSCLTSTGPRRFTLPVGITVLFVGITLSLLSVTVPHIIAPLLGSFPVKFSLLMVALPVTINGLFLTLLGLSARSSTKKTQKERDRPQQTALH